jgi:hypothetical protein
MVDSEQAHSCTEWAFPWIAVLGNFGLRKLLSRNVPKLRAGICVIGARTFLATKFI